MQNLMEHVHPQWHAMVLQALNVMDKQYLLELNSTDDWLPGKSAMFAAFRRPLTSVRYLLLGESPYPRVQSANGYAFWDAAVGSLWSERGLSKEVNRATSLRNLLKMLLLARGDLGEDISQDAIAALDKSALVQTGAQFFEGLQRRGFLLLNASLVYTEGKVNAHARRWQPFMEVLFQQLEKENPTLQLILLGRIAEKIPKTHFIPSLVAEHPYNISFITNPKVVAFFKPLDLLAKHENRNDH